MSGPRKLAPDDVAYCLRVARECGAPESSRHLAGHIAALEQELAAAEARGFERARDMAADDLAREARVVHGKYAERRNAGGKEEPGTTMVVSVLLGFVDRIRAMQDGQA